MSTSLHINDKTGANSFSSVFASPATTRAFFNNEIDAALVPYRLNWCIFWQNIQ
jgi:hypothetical protein